MRRLWPSMPSNAATSYQRSFDSHSSQQWQFDNIAVPVAGGSALATCSVRISQAGIRDGKLLTENRRCRISLRRTDSAWEIVGLQIEAQRWPPLFLQLTWQPASIVRACRSPAGATETLPG